ncbi:hypothetical protein Q1695_016118 [Nippostrongylus brasiliensis]|nr:hypothetical protein Q1695_016118 [Nippostrongylus brasiliensis]
MGDHVLTRTGHRGLRLQVPELEPSTGVSADLLVIGEDRSVVLIVLFDKLCAFACRVALSLPVCDPLYCPVMSERQQMEKIQQLADLKVQLQMAAMEAAVAKAEAEKAREQLDNLLKKREEVADLEKRHDDTSRSGK